MHHPNQYRIADTYQEHDYPFIRTNKLFHGSFTRDLSQSTWPAPTQRIVRRLGSSLKP